MAKRPEYAMDAIVHKFKTIGADDLNTVQNYPLMIRKLPPRLASDRMSLDERVAFKNQLEVCNKKYAAACKCIRPKQALFNLTEEITKLLRFYH